MDAGKPFPCVCHNEDFIITLAQSETGDCYNISNK